MSSNSRFPEIVMAVSCDQKDGLPVVGVMNIALTGYPFCGDFPWLLECELESVDLQENGMPSHQDLNRLNELELRIQSFLPKDETHFVARQTWNARRLLDFYLASPEPASEFLRQLAKEVKSERKILAKVTKDPDWSNWMPTLTRLGDPAAAGESEFDPNDHSVLIKIPLSEEFGTDKEQSAVIKLCDKLTKVVDKAEAGMVDGFEFGDHEGVIFVYGPDADELHAVMAPSLRKAKLPQGTTVSLRRGPIDSADTKEELVRL